MRIERRRSSATAVAYPSSYPSCPWHQAAAAVISRHDGTGSEFGTALCGTPQHVPITLESHRPRRRPRGSNPSPSATDPEGAAAGRLAGKRLERIR